MQAQPYHEITTDATVAEAVARHGTRAEAALPVLQTCQELNGGHLPDRVLASAADALGLSEAHVCGLATFYSMLSRRPRQEQIIRVCDGPICMLKGASKIRAVIERTAADARCNVERSSCLGLCDRAPAALIDAQPCGPIEEAQAGDALDGWRGGVPNYGQPMPGEVRIVLGRIGKVDPDSIESALAHGAYEPLASALRGDPSAVLAVVEDSGLQGRGGAGFPVGRKWRVAAETPRTPRYIICNADESEPGTFKDRVLMDGDPHLLLEGMALAGFAVGACEGIIYIRGEYEVVAQRLKRSIAKANAHGWLGDNVQGSSFSFQVHVHRGAGAYICGEESALLESLEGKRGEPRIRPPHAAVSGYRGMPTVVNNVESFCFIPLIVALGSAWFRALGTAHSPGTKVFTVTGAVQRPGAFEAPLGITLRHIIEEFGGGMLPGRRFQAALTGGAAGLFAPPALMDLPIDYASARHGVMLGSGAMMILDETVSIPRFLAWLLKFFEAESCGKCTPCRIGTREARVLAERLAANTGGENDVAELRRLARAFDAASFCGLGRSVAWPIESALKHFPAAFTKKGATSSEA